MVRYPLGWRWVPRERRLEGGWVTATSYSLEAAKCSFRQEVPSLLPKPALGLISCLAKILLAAEV